jgi:poly(3-hydroxybutyrate) depolymerase
LFGVVVAVARQPDGNPDRYASRGCVIAERWLVAGMNHAHSGGAPDQNYSDPKGPDAAAASWRFFASHPKQDTRVPRCSST